MSVPFTCDVRGCDRPPVVLCKAGGRVVDYALCDTHYSTNPTYDLPAVLGRSQRTFEQPGRSGNRIARRR